MTDVDWDDKESRQRHRERVRLEGDDVRAIAAQLEGSSTSYDPYAGHTLILVKVNGRDYELTPRRF